MVTGGESILLSTLTGRYLVVVLAGLALCICGCVPSKPAVVPQQNVGVTQRLEVAERLLWQGCFSCLVDAIHEYEEIQRLTTQSDNIRDAATVGPRPFSTRLWHISICRGLMKRVLSQRKFQTTSTSGTALANC
jgi:hypothetical protein